MVPVPGRWRGYASLTVIRSMHASLAVVQYLLDYTPSRLVGKELASRLPGSGEVMVSED